MLAACGGGDGDGDGGEDKEVDDDMGVAVVFEDSDEEDEKGDEENEASLKQIRSVLHDNAELGDVLVLGAGAGRLAYDIYRQLDSSRLVAVDFTLPAEEAELWWSACRAARR